MMKCGDRLTNIIRKKAEERLEEMKRYVEVQLDSAITLDKRHCSLVRHCKSFLINLNENGSIGYNVIMREPLLDLSLSIRDISVFDLIAINDTEKITSLIECKAGQSPRNILPSFVDKILSFKRHYKHLEKILGVDLKDFEFILCVESINAEGILQSIRSHIGRRKEGRSSQFNQLEWDEINRIIVWSVLSGENKIIKIYGKHIDPNLDAIMNDPPQFDSLSDLDLEYSSHPWRFIERIIYEKIFVKKNMQKIANPKEFTYSEVVDALVDEFRDLAVDNETLRSIAERKASEILNHGMDYEIFEKIGEDRFRIACRGERISTVIEHLEKKYRNNYVSKEAERKAYEEAEKEVKRKLKDLSDFGIV